MRECVNYNKIDSQTLQCSTCNHYCKITNGKVGICGVRQNINGKLQLLVYKKVVSLSPDPIEKKPLFHFLPGSNALSVGTLGCNFYCYNCHNYQISQMFEQKGKVDNYDSINWGHEFSPNQIVNAALELNCKSVAYTYNEPTVFMEFALDTMKLAKKQGLKNVWVSNGYFSSETFQLIQPYLDAINIDIKFFNNKKYLKYCGGKIKPILENCKKIVKNNIWLEITTLVVPTLSDDSKMFKEIAGFIKDELGDFIPWHISIFSGDISWKLKHLEDTKAETINKAYRIGKKAGLKYVYSGNLWNDKNANTICPKCGELFIKRVGYNITKFSKKAKCKKCNYLIEGIF